MLISRCFEELSTEIDEQAVFLSGIRSQALARSSGSKEPDSGSAGRQESHPAEGSSKPSVNTMQFTITLYFTLTKLF